MKQTPKQRKSSARRLKMRKHFATRKGFRVFRHSLLQPVYSNGILAQIKFDSHSDKLLYRPDINLSDLINFAKTL